MRRTIRSVTTMMMMFVFSAVLAWPGGARADSLDEYLLAVAGIRLGTLEGTYTFKEERTLLKVAWNQYRQQQKGKGLFFIGQTVIDDDYPSNLSTLGTLETLSFSFIDPDTGLPTTGPSIGSVLYEANLDPNNPHDFVTIGTSTDAGSNFSLPFTVIGFEPTIRATPFDTNGNPIVNLGVDDQNVAVGLGTTLFAPEPSSLLMAASGLGLLGYVRLRRKRVVVTVPVA